jgi:hypothetical protein
MSEEVKKCRFWLKNGWILPKMATFLLFLATFGRCNSFVSAFSGAKSFVFDGACKGGGGYDFASKHLILSDLGESGVR